MVLARRGFPGTGFRIPGGPAIPIVAGVACLTQFFSFGLTDILAAAAMLLGLALDSMRHRNLFAEEALDEIRDASAISRRRSPVRCVTPSVAALPSQTGAAECPPMNSERRSLS